jgi:hypothetical protein
VRANSCCIATNCVGASTAYLVKRRKNPVLRVVVFSFEKENMEKFQTE